MSTVISVSPDILGGTPVFAGTRVPVQTLLDYLKGGESIDDFLEGFPSVRREQVVAVLDEITDRIIPAASRKYSWTNALTGGLPENSLDTPSKPSPR